MASAAALTTATSSSVRERYQSAGGPVCYDDVLQPSASWLHRVDRADDGALPADGDALQPHDGPRPYGGVL